VNCRPASLLDHVSPTLAYNHTQATQFAVAATSQNALGRAAHDAKGDGESSDDPGDMAKTGRNPIGLFRLVAATAN